MADSRQLVRQWTILRMMSARRRGITVRELVDETGASVKTIRRDLDDLREVGFPLVDERHAHGRKSWSLDTPRHPPLAFNWDELAALHLGRCHLAPLEGTCFGDALRTALAKIRSGLPESALEYLADLASLVHRTRFGAGHYGDRADVVETLRTGVEDARVTTIQYDSRRSTAPVAYAVHPDGLVLHRDSLYLVAFSLHHDQRRHFKVDRVLAAELEAETFERPPDFDLAEHLARGFGIYEKPGPPIPVHLRFAPTAARYVRESHWHSTQRLIPTPTGHLDLHLEVTALEELQSWVLSFGDKCEVPEPQELRDGVAQTLAKTAAMYGVTIT